MKAVPLASSLLLALLLGAAMAFIRPAQPVQVGNGAANNLAFLTTSTGLLDNPLVVADLNIHPARKCTYHRTPCSV
jgi:hypothetical protein